MGKKLPLKIADANENDTARLSQYGDLLKFVARLDDIDILSGDDDKPESAIALVDSMQLLIPMAGLIDKDAEIKRLTRETEKLNKQVAALTAKLANPGFTGKAPANVVEAEQQKLSDFESALAQLNEQLAKIHAL